MDIHELLTQLSKQAIDKENEFLEQFIKNHFGTIDNFQAVSELYVLEEHTDVGRVYFADDYYHINTTSEYRIRRKTPEELRHDRVDDILARNSIAFHNCIVCNEPILVPKDTEVKTIHGYYHGAPYECMNGRQELMDVFSAQ